MMVYIIVDKGRVMIGNQPVFHSVYDSYNKATEALHRFYEAPGKGEDAYKDWVGN